MGIEDRAWYCQPCTAAQSFTTVVYHPNGEVCPNDDSMTVTYDQEEA